DLAEDRAFLGDSNVADHLENITPTHRIAVYRCNHRLLQFLNGLVHLERGQSSGIKDRIFHTRFTAAYAEEAVASSCQHHNPCSRLASDQFNTIAYLMAHRFGKHVPVIGSVQRDTCDGTNFLEKDLLEIHLL